MRARRTIFSIPIILLALMPFLYCAYFQVKERLIWMEMEERLERSNLQTISVPVKDFHWYEENREIVVVGMMFDVKSIERKGDDYIITGLFDKEETDLHIAMGRLQKQEQEGSDTSIIAKFVMDDQFYQPNNYTLQNTSIQLSSRPMLTEENLYCTILSLHTPPPRA